VIMCAQKIAIATDSTAYLPPALLERYGIFVMPLNLVWGEEVLKDGVDIRPTDFYHRLETAKVMPTTSQPSAGEFVDFFRQVAEQAGTDTIVAAFISAALSGTVASAEAARGMLSDLHIEIEDSRSTSMGLGFQVIAAAEVTQNGGTVKEAVEAMRRVRYSLNVMFVVDTLEFLHRGGRIGGGKRFLGTALQIKPLLQLEDGRIEPLEQVRTKKKALARLLEIASERKGGARVPRAAVVHANAPEDCQALMDEVNALLLPDDIFMTEVSPVIGTHTGPGTLGLGFYTA
jgi:DegV family protein with EDD domain